MARLESHTAPVQALTPQEQKRVIALVDRWRRRTQSDTLRPSDQMAQFRTLYERGELSAEEYDRIRGLLTERLVREMEGVPGGEAAKPPAPPDRSVNQKLERILKETRIASRPPHPPSPEPPPEQGPPPVP